MDDAQKRKWNGRDVLLWLVCRPWAVMRRIGRHARWSARTSNAAGSAAVIGFA
jgi:hypothetical protein